MRLLHPVLSGCLMALALTAPSHAQSFVADLTTQGNELLFDSSGPSAVLSPVNRALWVVADMGASPGIAGIEGGTIPQSYLNNINLGIGDDRRVDAGTLFVDGNILGDQPGKFSGQVESSENFSSAVGFYLFLWKDDQGIVEHGRQFGYSQLTVIPPAGMMPTQLIIDSPVYADQLSVVPEPAATALLMLTSSAVAGWILRRRRPHAGQ